MLLIIISFSSYSSEIHYITLIKNTNFKKYSSKIITIVWTFTVGGGLDFHIDRLTISTTILQSGLQMNHFHIYIVAYKTPNSSTLFSKQTVMFAMDIEARSNKSV